MANFITKAFDDFIYKIGACNDSQIATAFLASFKLFFIPIATMSDKKATKEQKEYAAARDMLTEAIALGTYIGITGVAQRYGTMPLSLGYYKNKAKLMREGKIPCIDPKKFSEADFKALENIDKKSFESVMLDNCFRAKGKGKATVAEKKYVEDLTNIVKKFEEAFPKAEKSTVTKDAVNKAKTIGEKLKSAFDLKQLKTNVKELFDSKAIIQTPDKLCKHVKLNISQMCIWTLAVFVIPPMCNALLKPVLSKFKEVQNKKGGTPQEPAKAIAYQNTQIEGIKKPNENTPTFKGYYNLGNIGNMRVGM